MGPDDRGEFKELGRRAVEIDEDADFWELFQECVEAIYVTTPDERLGMARTAMIARFGPINSKTWEHVENTIIRVVCWMSEFRNR